MTKLEWLLLRVLLGIFVFLALALPGRAQMEFYIDPARWTHEIELRIDGQPIVGMSGYSKGDPECPDSNGFVIRFGTGVESSYPGTDFSLWDLTANEYFTFSPSEAFPRPSLGAFIPVDGAPMSYFSVPGSRSVNALVVVYPALGISAPLSLSSRWGPNPADPWVEAIAVSYPGDFYVLDLTTYERASTNMKYLPGTQWEFSAADVPVDAWTFGFSAADAGYHFILEYGFQGQSGTPWMSRTLIPTLNVAEGYASVAAPLPRGASFYIRRLVDNAETQTYVADPNPPYWDFTTTFPARARRVQEFYVNAPVSGTFVARQPFGAFPAQITGTGQLMQFPNGYGGTNDFWYDVYSAEIDDQMVFALQRDGIETLPESATTWWGSFDPNAVPPAEQLTLDVFWKSVAGLYIATPDGQQIFGEQGVITSEARNSVWSAGPISQYDLKYYRLSLSVISNPGTSWSIAYPDSYGTMQSYGIAPGYHDWREWYPMPSSLQFQVSPSRYGHDLRLRQPHSTSEYFLNQSGSLGAYYEGGQIAYWYSVADGWAIPGLDFWVFDATTNESSVANSTSLGTGFI